MMKGYRWLALGAAGISLVIPGVAHAQNRAPVEQPLGQLGVGTAPSTGSGAALPQAQGSFKAPPLIRPGQPISVMVFPFGIVAPEGETAPAAPAGGVLPPDGGGAPAAGGLTLGQQHIAGYVTAAVKAGFLSSPYYLVASYHPNSSLIQRAQKDEILRPEQVQGIISSTTGGAEVERARVVTYRLGMQGLLVGTIDLKTDPKANTSEVTLDAQLINSTTGEVIRSAAVSGAAAGAAGVPMDIVEERAAQDAAQKVLPALGIQLVPLPSEGSPPSKSAASKAPATKSGSDREARKAAAEAKKAAADAKKAEEAAKRQAKADAEKAERAAREEARAAEKAKKDAEKRAKAEKTTAAAAEAPKVQQDAPAPAPAPNTPAAAAQEPTAEPSVTGTVPGTSNAAGQPVPYGYALGESRTALPERDRGGLKVPAWMGVAAFLYGLSFLVF